MDNSKLFGQKFRRLKHNLVNTSKTDANGGLGHVQQLEQRNKRIVGALSTFRKNITGIVKTGPRENPEKRKKKLDEFGLCNDLREGAVDLEKVQTTCLHKVMEKMGQTLSLIADEQVRFEMAIENRILDALVQYQEDEKILSKNKEKLMNACTDLNIARRDYEKTKESEGKDPSKDEENYEQVRVLGERADAIYNEVEHQRDGVITKIYSLTGKEQEIAKIFVALLEEKLEYHRMAMQTIEKNLPDIKNSIDAARPRPVFNVDLTEHLRHTQERIATVLDRCCEYLRAKKPYEKGMFRISGDITKVRRLKAAFDAGQFDKDCMHGNPDIHAVCSVLKMYLRELPDPLLTNRLRNDWVAAAACDGEAQMLAVERCIGQLPAAHRDNLTYLMSFLHELLAHQDDTAMNESNLAIVFGPNLLTADVEGSNSAGTRVVEILLRNAPRLFGCQPLASKAKNNGRLVDDMMPSSASSLSSETGSFSPDVARRTRWSPQEHFASPRAGRPKEKAPPPPPNKIQPIPGLVSNLTEPEALITITDRPSPRSDCFAQSDDSFDDDFDETDNTFGHDGSLSRSYTESRPHRPPPPVFRTNSTAPVHSRPNSYNMAVGVPAADHGQRLVQSVIESAPIRRPVVIPETVGEVDSMNRTIVAVDIPAPQQPKLETSKHVQSGPPPPVPLASSKPPLPAKPRTDDKETYRL